MRPFSEYFLSLLMDELITLCIYIYICHKIKMIVFLFYFTFNDLYGIRELFLVYFVTECVKHFMPFGWGVKKVFFSKQEN